MGDKKYLKFKFYLQILGTVSVLIWSFIHLDNLVFRSSLDFGFLILVFFYYVRPTLRGYGDENISVVFREFDFRWAIVETLVWCFLGFVSFSDHGEIEYLMFVLGMSFFVIERNIKVVTFDYGKRIVTGLFNKKDSIDVLTIEGDLKNNPEEIRVTGKYETTLVHKNEYVERSWVTLRENLRKCARLYNERTH